MNLKLTTKVNVGDKVKLKNDNKNIYEVIKVDRNLISVYRSDLSNIVYMKISPRRIKEVIK